MIIKTCGARCRAGHACQARPAPGRARCKLHGGRSTGPRTLEGRARIGQANAARKGTRYKPKAPSIEARTLPDPQAPAAVPDVEPDHADALIVQLRKMPPDVRAALEAKLRAQARALLVEASQRRA